jgi:hypothetical protein
MAFGKTEGQIHNAFVVADRVVICNQHERFNRLLERDRAAVLSSAHKHQICIRSNAYFMPYSVAGDEVAVIQGIERCVRWIRAPIAGRKDFPRVGV